MKPVKIYAVNSEENSRCTSDVPLKDLDFSNWWQDFSFGENYLHVKSKDKTKGTSHRVKCRHSDKPRLGMIDGELKWFVE